MAGGIAAGLNWLLRFPLSVVLPYGAAVLVANVIGMLAGFFLYRAMVFGPSDKPLRLQIRDFVLVNFASIIVVTLLAVVACSLFVRMIIEPIAEALAHAVAIMVGAVLNYAGHSRFTFKVQPSSLEADEQPSSIHP